MKLDIWPLLETKKRRRKLLEDIAHTQLIQLVMHGTLMPQMNKLTLNQTVMIPHQKPLLHQLPPQLLPQSRPMPNQKIKPPPKPNLSSQLLRKLKMLRSPPSLKSRPLSQLRKLKLPRKKRKQLKLKSLLLILKEA